MIATLFASLAAFIATNTDDLFINMLLFSAAADKKQIFAIVQGKFLGTARLLIISGSAAFGLQFLAGNRLWLLGFVPVAIGIRNNSFHRCCEHSLYHPCQRCRQHWCVYSIAGWF